MSTLWTPGGEQPIRREPAEPDEALLVEGGAQPLTPEEQAARLREIQEQLAATPVELVIANHAFGLFELAALHLGTRQLDKARVAIDAFGALVEGMAGRLGDHEKEL